MAEDRTPPDHPESALHVAPGVDADAVQRTRPIVKRRSLGIDDYADGVLAGDRAIVGRTFSLMESLNPAHRTQANAVLDRLMPHTGKSIRMGITGVPGVGKSTLIDLLGTQLTERGHRVAVLAVDPTSELSGGSILGDKTRMEKLSRDERALVRPTACGGWLGGVARGTRESILVCEAAGYDVVIVETVGVGQSETQVASMVDFFLLLMISGAGDELQGLKRGIIEMADAVAINKADGDNVKRAELARAEFQSALRLLRPASEGWQPRVLTCSAVTGHGIEGIWHLVQQHHQLLKSDGGLLAKRQRQALFWMKQALEHLLIDRFYRDERVAGQLEAIRAEVLEGKVSPFAAAERLLEAAEKNSSEKTRGDASP